MIEYLRLLYEGATEVSPDEVMGALMVGLALALACYGLCALGRTRAENPLPLLCGLFFLISALSMAVGVGHSHYRSAKGTGPDGRAVASLGPGGSPRPGGPGGPPSQHRIGRILLHHADANRDGRLTPDEAAQFVREADRTKKGWVDGYEIDQTSPEIVGPPPIQYFHPDTPRSGRARIGKTS